MTMISLIAAMTKDRVIGVNNAMPWHAPEELQHFKQITLGKTMIMGRKTFESIGRRILPGRKTIILTKDANLVVAGVEVANTVEQALQVAGDVAEVMVVGGETVYKEFFPLADRIYLSILGDEYLTPEGSGDAYFPQFDATEWYLVDEQQHTKFTVKVFDRNRQ